MTRRRENDARRNIGKFPTKRQRKKGNEIDRRCACCRGTASVNAQQEMAVARVTANVNAQQEMAVARVPGRSCRRGF